MNPARQITTVGRLALMLAGGALFATSAQAQSSTPIYNPGDVLLGFQAMGGTGANTNFVFNVGYSVDFRDGTVSGTLFNIGPVLASIYGPNWFDREDLFWGGVAVRNNQNPNLSFARPPVVDGDPSATIYITRPATAPGNSAAHPRIVPAGIVVTATNIRSLTDLGQPAQGVFNQQPVEPNTSNRGVRTNTEGQNTWSFANPRPAAAFGSIVGGVESNFGTGGDYSFVDLYRILASDLGAEPTGPVGDGVLVGTFAINSQGDVSFIPVGSSDLPSWLVGEELVSLGDGWYFLPWFGILWIDGEWVYHAEHGWLYGIGTEDRDFYFYDTALGWLFTSPVDGLYPWLFAFAVNDWVYFFEDTVTPNRSFFAATPGQIVSEANLPSLYIP